MTSPRQLPSGRWRVRIRRKGSPRYDKIFPNREEAEAWAADIERSLLTAKAAGASAAKPAGKRPRLRNCATAAPNTDPEQLSPRKAEGGISPRLLPSGRWRVLIRRKGVPRYDNIFPNREEAVAWLVKIEEEILRAKLLATTGNAGAALALTQAISTDCTVVKLPATTPEQLPCGNWQVQIRRKGFPRHNKTFPTQEETVAWVARVERQLQQIQRTPHEKNQRDVLAPAISKVREGGGSATHRQRLLSPERRKQIEAVLAGTLVVTMSTKFKRILIEFGYLQDVCVSCGTGPEWAGLPLVLHLDHINGNRDDNRKNNLRLLCPNCHTQTPTYAGRNRKLKSAASKKVVDDEAFTRALLAAGSIREALLALGLRGAGANYVRARRLLLTMLRNGKAPDWA